MTVILSCNCDPKKDVSVLANINISFTASDALMDSAGVSRCSAADILNTAV